jgi:flagellar hook-associated protein 3 FlgL
MSSSVPINLARVPNLLRSQLLLGNITRTNIELLRIQSQLASGQQVTSFVDDPVAASAISVLRQRLDTGTQVARNLDNADRTLTFLDSTVGDTIDLAQQAKTLASGQIGATSDAQTRSNQSVVVEGYLRQLFLLSNRQTNDIYVFGGSTAASAPVQEIRSGFRYTGRGSGMYAELGPAADVPLTIGGQNAVGETSIRVRSSVDLSPNLTNSTRLSDVYGTRRLGIAPGTINFQFGTGPVASVDLSGAETAEDIVTQLTAAIRSYETANSVTILGPGGVSLSGRSFNIDVVPGLPTNPELRFTDIGVGSTALDLGLAAAPFTDTNATGISVEPKLALLSQLSSIPGISVPLGTIRFRFTSGAGTSQSSSVADVNLSSAQSIDDLRSLIETTVPGIRVVINSQGTGIEVVSEVAGPSVAIESGPGTPDTATELGIRTALVGTPISEFNEGRGVAIVDNVNDPTTGSPTRSFNTDMRIVLGNGQAFDVDFRPQDMASIQTVLDRINAEFATAVTQPPIVTSAPPLAAGQLTASLGPRGIQLAQTGVTGPITVGKLNNSAAAEDLGLLGGTYDAPSATFAAQDRTAARINDNLFSALIRLRDSLRADDSSGIALAGQELDSAIGRLSGTQALVGVYANRITNAQATQEDQNTTSEAMRSQLQDIDVSSAIIRLTTLQNQLQAVYNVGGQLNSLSLLNFLR